jgi:hypothetical protein
MIQKIIILSFFIISCQTSTKKNISGEVQEIKTEMQEIVQIDKCDIKKVVNLKKQLPSNATYELIKSFLLTISRDCSNNVEFIQFANEVLFETLNTSPLIVLEVIEKENIEKSEIYRMLETPISDAINLNELILRINNLEIESIGKEKVINSLEIAVNK